MKWPAAIALALGLAGCASTPLSYLDATSPIGGPIAELGWGLTAISVGVCIIVGILLLVAILRRRPSSAGTIGPVNDRTSIRWIGIGVAISTVFLLGSAVWTLVTVNIIGQPAASNTISVDVIGQEWWWGVHYNSSDPARQFTTANQLVIPVGVPVQINLRSNDVIHSFWVPKLGGKMDMIPSRTNVTWIEADKPGTYRGQCSEFCGLQHANMAFTVKAVSQADFDAWWTRQLAPPATAPDDPRLATFMTRCAACHAIRGTPAGGIVGPDLSHFGSRPTIASGLLPNTAANLASWINNTQTIKPGVKMPQLHMLASEIDDVTSFLEELQ
ncbi:MAG: cytochrome c oxidase subunit II [Devosia sp.]